MIRDDSNPDEDSAPVVEEVGNWLWGANEADEAFFKVLRERWEPLHAWWTAVPGRAPEIAPFYEKWRAYRTAVEAGSFDEDALQDQEINLNSAERFAESKGYPRPGSAGPGGPQTQGDARAPDLEDRSGVNKILSGVDEGAKAVEGGARDLRRDLEREAGGAWDAIPLPLKIGGGALLALVVVSAVGNLTNSGGRRY